MADSHVNLEHITPQDGPKTPDALASLFSQATQTDTAANSGVDTTAQQADIGGISGDWLAKSAGKRSGTYKS